MQWELEAITLLRSYSSDVYFDVSYPGQDFGSRKHFVSGNKCGICANAAVHAATNTCAERSNAAARTGAHTRNHHPDESDSASSSRANESDSTAGIWRYTNAVANSVAR
jgi:hypothetical protein